ncbi:5'-3' exonuclease [Salsipaludibacter albus]|uniref:5'-3' exonuclease n=1 Tax=Salsipaludibacter albus TaxID=2849650 RepID=UPI001EE3E5FA|nr:5'-3' exonuclease H3TH domain-containing protein [Salsipaludibacter albus]MBY5161633.1 flap endonuclease [Salsipaludibacter albus]
MRLHLVDGTFELFRAHFSPGPSREAGGRDVKATVGVVRTLLALLDDPDEAVTHLAVAYDNPIESWRNETFPAYKDGSGIEQELLDQFDLVEEATAALGIVVWSMQQWEADDALGTAAVRWCDDVDQVRVMTVDKDLGQVVSGDRIVQVDRMRDREFDEQGVVARLGVPPASVPDYLALVGDTADGIPGLRGFGAKTAATLLTRWGHLEDIPADPDDWDVPVRGAARLAETLAAEREAAELYRHLATLSLDVPLAEELDDLAHAGVPRSATATFDRLEVDLADRVATWAD